MQQRLNYYYQTHLREDFILKCSTLNVMSTPQILAVSIVATTQSQFILDLICGQMSGIHKTHYRKKYAYNFLEKLPPCDFQIHNQVIQFTVASRFIRLFPEVINHPEIINHFDLIFPSDLQISITTSTVNEQETRLICTAF